jgi:hypothetical protein|tara:strand:+ start:2801 stop:3280 length:480 start_codon:yes stop_codon:yes gene_type:complete
MKQELINKLPENVMNNIYDYIAPDYRLCVWMNKYNMKEILLGIIEHYMFGAIKIVELFDRYFPEDSWELYEYIINNRKWEDIKSGIHCLYEDSHIDMDKFTNDVLRKMTKVLYYDNGIIPSYKVAASYIFLYQNRLNLKEPCREDFQEIQDNVDKIGQS